MPGLKQTLGTSNFQFNQFLPFCPPALLLRVKFCLCSMILHVWEQRQFRLQVWQFYSVLQKCPVHIMQFIVKRLEPTTVGPWCCFVCKRGYRMTLVYLFLTFDLVWKSDLDLPFSRYTKNFTTPRLPKKKQNPPGATALSNQVCDVVLPSCYMLSDWTL